MILARDLKSLVRRIEALKYRLTHYNDSTFSRLKEKECIRVRYVLEEAKQASIERCVGQQRRNEKQSIKRCIILSGLVNDILTKEKELQEMIEAKLNLVDKRLKEL